MATAWFGPCPHCHIPLSYLQGVTGSTMSPKCPRCRQLVEVTRATFLMADHSAPSPQVALAKRIKAAAAPVTEER
jgi:hypothetical protein